MGKILAEDGLPIGYDDFDMEWLVDRDDDIAFAEVCDTQGGNLCVSISVFNLDKTQANEIILTEKDLRRILKIMKI